MFANQSMITLPQSQVAESAPASRSCNDLSARPLYQLCKRIVDFVSSGVLLVICAPIWLLLALMIKLDSKGPVFFVQPAVGYKEREFLLYKFRSMFPNSQQSDHFADIERNFHRSEPTGADSNGPIFKTALTDESRITRAGRFLRRTSLDELPQIWNVLRGDMSFIGPRPALPYEARLYKEWQKQRFLVRPGLTGLYQVTARNRVPIDEMIHLDLDYIRRQSLWLDLKILLKTPAAMLSGL